jgi:hypothetical protein
VVRRCQPHGALIQPDINDRASSCGSKHDQFLSAMLALLTINLSIIVRSALLGCAELGDKTPAGDETDLQRFAVLGAGVRQACQPQSSG